MCECYRTEGINSVLEGEREGEGEGEGEGEREGEKARSA